PGEVHASDLCPEVRRRVPACIRVVLRRRPQRLRPRRVDGGVGLSPRCTTLSTRHAGSNTERWLGRKDSNLRVADPKSAALPLGDSPEPGRSYRGYAPAAVDANASVAVSGVMTARTSHSWSTPRNSLGVSICGMWPESS